MNRNSWIFLSLSLSYFLLLRINILILVLFFLSLFLKMIMFIICDKDNKILFLCYEIQILYNNTKNIQFFYVKNCVFLLYWEIIIIVRRISLFHLFEKDIMIVKLFYLNRSFFLLIICEDKILYLCYEIQILYSNTKNIQFFYIKNCVFYWEIIIIVKRIRSFHLF